MPDCYAKDCKSRGSRSRKNKKQLQWEESHGKISFHRIPKDPLERKKWLDGMGLEASNVPETAASCSLHFNEKDLDRTSLCCTRLYPGAVPFVFASKYPKEKEPLSQHHKVQKEHCVRQQEIADYTSNHQILDNTVSRKDSCTSQRLTFARRGTAVFPCLSDNTPRKKIMRNALNNTKIACRRKIRMFFFRRKLSVLP